VAPNLTCLPEWSALLAHCEKTHGISLNEIFSADPERGTRYLLKTSGITADFSRNHITGETIDLLVKLAEARDLAGWRTRLFGGDKINNTENRAVLHTALRASGETPVMVDGHDVMPEIKHLQQRMEIFCNDVKNGIWTGATGKPIIDIVNIGIGGSDLGPRLTAKALANYVTGPRAHFVANADAADLFGVLRKINPETALFVVVSKTFTTQETLLNANSARKWLSEKLGEKAVARHFVAVSANTGAASDFGISAGNIFPMWDWTGGRFSLWSSVGLAVAISIGWDSFRKLLDGAAAMDEHFLTAPFEHNMPVMLALTGIWYRNFRGSQCHAVLPYSEKLRELPRYLQQLEMESNGKYVTREGEKIDYATAPAVIGECGTIGQHSFHQWLHQGTGVVTCDFIGIREDDSGKHEHHKVLLANLVAQAEALKKGRPSGNPHRSNPGDRPSTILWLDRLDPFCLGQLLALYEHKVFVQGIVWGINSFDQWGVELGKELARLEMESKP